MIITVATFEGRKIQIGDLSLSTSVAHVKRIVAQELGVEATAVHLLYLGRQLETGVLSEYNMTDDALVHYLKKQIGGK